MVKERDLEFKNLKMAISTKANGITISQMAPASILVTTALSIKETLRMDCLTGTVPQPNLTVIPMMEIGLMTAKTVTAKKNGVLDQPIKDIIGMERKMEKVLILGLTGHGMRETGPII